MAQADARKKEEEERGRAIRRATLIEERQGESLHQLIKVFEKKVGVKLHPSEIEFVPGTSSDVLVARIELDGNIFIVNCIFKFSGHFFENKWIFDIMVHTDKGGVRINRPSDLIEYGIC